MILIICLPLSIWTILKDNSVNNIHFYTINSLDRISKINSHSVGLIKNSELREIYKLPDIYIDMSCTDKEFSEKTLFFINNSNPDCNDVFKGHKGTYLFVAEPNPFRSSSPSQNRILFEDFAELRRAVELLGIMYISANVPTFDDIYKYLECSQDNMVDVLPTTENNDLKVREINNKISNSIN